MLPNRVAAKQSFKQISRNRRVDFHLPVLRIPRHGRTEEHPFGRRKLPKGE